MAASSAMATERGVKERGGGARRGRERDGAERTSWVTRKSGRTSGPGPYTGPSGVPLKERKNGTKENRSVRFAFFLPKGFLSSEERTTY